MKATGIAAVVLVVLGIAVILYRLKRGWETWGDLIQVFLAVATVLAIVNTPENGATKSILGGLYVGTFATGWYWIERPKVKPPEVSLTPQTKEQAMFQQRLHAAIGWAILVIVVAHITLIVLEIVGRLTPVWIGIAVASVAFVSLVALRLRKALRESGPPFDRVSRLAKPKRW